MKTKYPSIFGILAIFMLVASLVVPANLASPTTAEAGFDAGVCKWDTLEMPNSQVGRWDILASSEVDKLVVAPDDSTLLAVVGLSGNPFATFGALGQPILMVGSMKGINWDYTQYTHLVSDMTAKYGTLGADYNVFDVACAPDDAKFWAVVTSDDSSTGPVEVWVTDDAGANWECTDLNVGGANKAIGCLDISMDYGGKRDIAVGQRAGGAFTIYVLKSTGFTGWNLQTSPPVVTADIIDLKFSPTYVGDASMAVVYANTTGVPATEGTWYNVALRDLANNNIETWTFGAGVEVCSASPGTNSPLDTEIITADLELPSDFSGQSASLRRAYVSTYGTQTTASGSDGIFRFDDT